MTQEISTQDGSVATNCLVNIQGYVGIMLMLAAGCAYWAWHNVSAALAEDRQKQQEYEDNIENACIQMAKDYNISYEEAREAWRKSNGR